MLVRRTAIAILGTILTTSAATQPARLPMPASEVHQALEAAERGDPEPARRVLRTGRGGADAILLRARLAAASHQGAPHRDPGLLRLASEGSSSQQRAALNIVASAAFAAGEYRPASEAAGRLAALLRAANDAQGGASAERTQQVASMLAGYPGQRVEGRLVPQAVPLRTDAVGLPRIDVSVNGRSQEAVVDTGANLSVMSVETALQLGVAVAGPAGSVGNSAGGTVQIRMGRVDRLTIAGSTLRDVPFLIIDDAQLTFAAAGGYRIRAIIGLPVLRALGRVRMEGEHFAVEPPQPFDPARQNLFAGGNDLFLTVEMEGRRVPLLLDTGANRTYLSALFASAHPPLVAGLTSTEQQIAGAGGARRTAAVTWREPGVAVAGRAMPLPSISIALPVPGTNPANYGTIGMDALRLLGGFAIDFQAMRLEPRDPVGR